MRRSKRGDKEGQGRGQGSNLRGHLPGSDKERGEIGTGRENPAAKHENPLDLVTSWAMLSVADICQARCTAAIYVFYGGCVSGPILSWV